MLDKIVEARKSYKDKRKFVDNTETRRIINDLHNKTHFKVVIRFIISKNTSSVQEEQNRD